MAPSSIADELLRVLLAHEEGVSDDVIKETFGTRYELVAPAINELLSVNRLQLFTQNGTLVYKAIREETAMKFDGLGCVFFLHVTNLTKRHDLLVKSQTGANAGVSSHRTLWKQVSCDL